MLVYLGMFAYVSIGAIINSFRAAQLRQGQLWITAVILIVLVGFRWHVGADWTAYRTALEYAGFANPNLNLRMEPGYAALNSLAAMQGWGIWFPNLVCATIFTYGLIVFCRHQPNPWLALVVAVPYLIIGVGMGYTRQSAAVGLTMLATVQLVRGARAEMFVSIGLATLFHTSAIVLAPLFALTIARRGFVTAVILAVFAVGLYFAFSQRIALRMSEYETFKYTAGGAIPRILMNVVAASIYLLYRRRFTVVSEELRIWTLFSLVSFLMLPLLYFVNSTTVVDRIGIFLIPLQVFVLARAPLVFGHKGRQNFAFLMAIIFYSLAAELVWLNLGNEARSWIPYRNLLWEDAVA